MNRLMFERKLKFATMAHLDRRIPGVKQAVRREIAAELANSAADHYANALSEVKAKYTDKPRKKICPYCNGDGFLTVKHASEPNDYHDCKTCDCSGEVAA